MPYFQPTLSANPRVSQMSHLSLICVETQEKWNQDAALKGISNIHIKRTEKKKHKKMKEALGGKKNGQLSCSRGVMKAESGINGDFIERTI